MKRVISAILALVMVLSLSITAFAVDGPQHTITITNDVAGHEYAAFRVFKGDLNSATATTNPEQVLSDIEWGESISDTNTLLIALQSLEETPGVKPFENATTATDVAKALVGRQNDSEFLIKFAAVVGEHLVAATTQDKVWKSAAAVASGTEYKYEIKVPGDGYYLIKDIGTYSNGDSASRIILQVVRDVEVAAKDLTVTNDKNIRKMNGEQFDLVHKDDYNVGDPVIFEITGTIPDMTGYTKYEYVMNDKMTSGLTPVVDANGNLVIDSIAIGNVDAEGKMPAVSHAINESEYELTMGADKKSFKISFKNMLDYQKYAGQTIMVVYKAVLNDAALITNTESNESWIEYTNNPYDGGKGETTKKKNFVFDFDITIDKWTQVDAQNTKKLEGAKFVLYKLDKDSKPVFYKWTPPAGGKDGKVEWVTVADYTEHKASDNKATPGVLDAADKKEITEVTTDVNGAAKFEGLDTGTYYVLETDAPDGYNTLADVATVVITAEYDDLGNITSASTNVTYNNTNQPFATQSIENKAGTVLPSTGGVGTTIFYILGAAMMFGAAVILITKRRMADV